MKNQIKDQRATGLKKMRKIGEVTSENEGKSSQGKMNLRTEMETSRSASSVPPNPQHVGREYLGRVFWDDDPELFWEPPKEMVGQYDGQVQHESWTQLCGGLNLHPWSEAIGYQHYCPSGCPNPDLRPRMKAMSFRHGVAYVDENSRDGAPVHGPWSQQRFCLPPPGRTQDQWVYLEDEGNQYWIKVHHSLRTKKFHPVHRGQPMDVDLLEPMRMTVMFSGGGPPRRCLDKWTTPDEGKPDRWTGLPSTSLEKMPVLRWASSDGKDDWRRVSDYEVNWKRGFSCQRSGNSIGRGLCEQLHWIEWIYDSRRTEWISST